VRVDDRENVYTKYNVIVLHCICMSIYAYICYINIHICMYGYQFRAFTPQLKRGAAQSRRVGGIFVNLSIEKDSKKKNRNAATHCNTLYYTAVHTGGEEGRH